MSEPDFTSLEMMSDRELSSVRNFKIWNNHGSVEWFGEVDLTGVDFANDIVIEPLSVEIYPDSIYNAKTGIVKPEPFSKLNKPALISLFNVKPSAT
jgi:hypothetical protein